MKEYFLDLHHEMCLSRVRPNDDLIYNSCDMNPKRFLFFYGSDFYLITYFKCLSEYDEYDFKMSLVEATIKNSKTISEYRYICERGVSVREKLREFRLKNRSINRNIMQVNYIYGHAGKYAITTTIKFIDAVFNQDKIDDNYNTSRKILTKRGDYFLLKELDALYNANRLEDEDKAEYHKTVDHLIKSINKSIN